MMQRKKKTTRKKTSKKKASVSVNIIRLFSLLFLFLILVFSVCTVGYVIFFRTVVAQEIPAASGSAIAIAEPNPQFTWNL